MCNETDDGHLIFSINVANQPHSSFKVSTNWRDVIDKIRKK